MSEYNGTIELISGITPKNGGNFPLVNDKDVLLSNGARLSDLKINGVKPDENGNVQVQGVVPIVAYANVKDYGAVGDGVTDDTAAINECLASNRYVYIPSGTYLLTNGNSIIMHDNQVLELADNSVIKATIPDEEKYYYAIKIDKKHDVVIRGGKIIGDRDENYEPKKERGYGIHINQSQSVSVENCEICGFRGDCIIIESYDSEDYLNGSNYDNIVCRDVAIKGCKIHNALRHCITVMGIYGFTLKDTELYDANGKDYSCAMDAEAHAEWQVMRDFYIENVTSRDCTLGVLFQSGYKSVIGGNMDIISNVFIKNCNLHALSLRLPKNADIQNSIIGQLGTRYVEEITVNNSVIEAALIYESSKKVTFNNCVLDASEKFGSNNIALSSDGESVSLVELTLNNCICTSFASDVKDNSAQMIASAITPVSITANNCCFNINNPNPFTLFATEFVKAYGCRMIYKFNQKGYPSPLIQCESAENYVVGNVFDTTQATATNNDKSVLVSYSGNVLFANNVGVMTNKYGTALSYAGTATGRTWTMLNNVFRHYPHKGIESAEVTYVDVGNIYSSTT